MPRFRIITTVALLAGVASAQSFNLDLGSDLHNGPPSPSYGAAAGQAGFWNNGSLPALWSPISLKDLAGNPTGVTVVAYAQTYVGGNHVHVDNPLTSGDDELLMDDGIDVGMLYMGDEYVQFTFEGLEDGAYEVYAYSMAPENQDWTTYVRAYGIGWASGEECGGIWPGHHEEHISFVTRCGVLSPWPLIVKFSLDWDGGLYGTANGIQIVKRPVSCDYVGVGYCFGDPGFGTPCPCGNDNDGSLGGAGCASGVFASGAQLRGLGEASVTGDSLALLAKFQEPINVGLYFQGTTALSQGLIWGDGLLCSGGVIRRLEVRPTNASGSSQTTISLASAGGVSAGETRYYQCWYRNPRNSPCGFEFNATNGLVIAWLP